MKHNFSQSSLSIGRGMLTASTLVLPIIGLQNWISTLLKIFLVVLIFSAFLKPTVMKLIFYLWKAITFSKLIGQNLQNAPRSFGGLAVGVKSALIKGVKFLKTTSSEFMWFKLCEKFFHMDDDIYVCNVYISPVNSSYSSQRDDIFDFLNWVNVYYLAILMPEHLWMLILLYMILIHLLM